VTFLFTDVVGSTRLWAADSEAMSASLLVHDAVVRGAIESAGGYVFTTAGDSFAAAFARASDAVAAAQHAQAELVGVEWPGPVLRVRIGIHLGEAEERGGDYFGPAVNTAARVEAAGHGGQTLVTETVRTAARVPATDLGVHRLRDVDEPVRLFQIGDGAFGPLRVAGNTPESNLPVRPTRLIGRETELAAARRLLAANRLVTLAAVGGSGKTRLAVAVGEEELNNRSGGVWFVDLTAVMNPDDVPAAVAGASGLRMTSGDPARQVIEFFADKAALVILDNCEHVIDGCADFAESFLATAGDTVLLATSREALDVGGEQIMHLASLGSAGAEDSPAVALFVERAGAVAPEFAMTDSDKAIVAELCDRLDGMPLAIELAAARVTVMSPAELLEGLGDRFNLLSGGRRRQRQRTLEAALDWSYELLEPEQQRVFRALGVFVGGFDLDAVAAIADLERGAALDLVDTLVAKSLVVRAEGGDVSRFTLLETLKAYAENRLVQTGEAASIQDRHLHHFHRLASTRGRTMTADIRVGEQLRYDRSNLDAAFDCAAGRNHWTLAGELLLGSLAAYENYGHCSEAAALFRRCEQPLNDADPDLADHLRAAILWALMVLDDFLTVDRVAQQLLDSPDPRCRTMSCGVLSLVTKSPGRAAEYLEQGARDLAVAQSEYPGLNTDIVHGNLLVTKAFQLAFRGDYAAALAAIDEHPDNLARHDHVSGMDVGPNSQAAMCHLLLGEPTKALDRLEPFTRVSYPYGDHDEIRALAYLALGDLAAAREHARAHALEAATGRLSRQCNDAVLVLAALAHAEGDNEAAADLLLHMGVGRTPSTFWYATDLGEQVGVSDQYTKHIQLVRDPVNQAEHGFSGARTGMNTLRAEVARRGWS